MKNIIFNIILIFIMVVVFFIVGEVCFRLFDKQPNELYKITQKKSEYLFEPNLVKKNKSSIDGEFEYTAHINKYGYRGKDFLLPKPENVLRIFAVGDSFTFGVGAKDSETIPFLLEKRLREMNINAEVINAGVGHASPIKHYVNLRDIHLQYEPDLVLLLFDLTDLWDDWHSERNAVYGKDGEIVRFDETYINGKKDWWITCMKYSYFCRWINRKIVRTFKKIKHLGFKRYMKIAIEGKRAKAEIANMKNKDAGKFQIEYDGLLMMRGRGKKDLIEKHWKRTRKYLKKIEDLLDKNNIPHIIVMYPQGIYVGKDEWSKGRSTWGFEENKLYTDRYPFELVEAYSREQGIPFINTLDDFLNAKNKTGNKYFYDWDGHMTPAGYKVVAESIVSSQVFKKELKKFMPYQIFE